MFKKFEKAIESEIESKDRSYFEWKENQKKVQHLQINRGSELDIEI